VSRRARLGVLLAVIAGALVALWGGRRRPRPMPARPGVRARIARCPIHGIAFDSELEACPDCAKAVGAPGARG
jgi:hypothetical protein